MLVYISSPAWTVMRELAKRCPWIKLNILLSMAWMPSKYKLFFAEFGHIINSVMLDNGAFSAVRDKLDITLGQLLARFSAHSKINGERYVMVFSPDFKFGLEGFEENYEMLLDMKELGIEVVPVIHNLENHELWSYADEGHEFIAIGQCKGRRNPKVLFPAVNRLYKDFNVKVHLFGITTPSLLFGCSAFSCDSKSALDDARTGIVRFLNPINSEVEKTDVIYFPDELDKTKKGAVTWYNYPHQEVFKELILEPLKLTIEEFTGGKEVLYRQIASILYYHQLGEVATSIQIKAGLIE